MLCLNTRFENECRRETDRQTDRDTQRDIQTEEQRQRDRELELENFILQGLEREREGESERWGENSEYCSFTSSNNRS